MRAVPGYFHDDDRAFDCKFLPVNVILEKPRFKDLSSKGPEGREQQQLLSSKKPLVITLDPKSSDPLKKMYFTHAVQDVTDKVRSGS